MNIISDTLIGAIGRYRVLNEREKTGIENVVENWGYETREDNTERFRKVLSKAEPIKGRSIAERADDKTKEIIKVLGSDQNISSFLDFGAGDGSITESMAKRLKIKSDKAFAIEPKDMPANNTFTQLLSIDDLEDNSVDLAIVLETLHHIHPKKRSDILKSIHRTLKPDGRLVIQEHNYQETPFHYCSLDIYHNYWYISNDEEYDPLYLMTQSKCKDMITTAGFRLENQNGPVTSKWQQIYWASFVKST